MTPSLVPDLTDRPMETGGRIRAFLLLIFLAPWTALWGSWSVVAGLCGSAWMYRTGMSTWSRGILFISGIKLRVTRQGELNPALSYTFFSNHQSALDIPILFAACLKTHDIRFMAKESLFKIPFLGWGMRCTGFIPIHRENARKFVEIFRQTTGSQQTNMHSYVIFPEGTRSSDGRLQPFKSGTIGLAQRMGLPIVPITLIDSFRANPKGKCRVRKGTVQVIFHEPLQVSGDGDGENRTRRDELVVITHATIASALPGEQKEPARNPNQVC